MSVFIARGVVGAGRGGISRAGRFTYLSEVSADWYQWDGEHKATHFASPDEAMTAAAACKGPWFNHPDPDTVEAIPL
ncbi:MAG: hypothetical protein K8R60_01755 [Burkholderiales bacterium]|nr:hypothetical protein [Burkholderiales bacterium]